MLAEQFSESPVTCGGIAAQYFRQLGDGAKHLPFGFNQVLLISRRRARQLQRLCSSVTQGLAPLFDAHIEGQPEAWKHREEQEQQQAHLKTPEESRQHVSSSAHLATTRLYSGINPDPLGRRLITLRFRLECSK
jgi:hypothetical protein